MMNNGQLPINPIQGMYIKYVEVGEWRIFQIFKKIFCPRNYRWLGKLL